MAYVNRNEHRPEISPKLLTDTEIENQLAIEKLLLRDLKGASHFSRWIWVAGALFFAIRQNDILLAIILCIFAILFGLGFYPKFSARNKGELLNEFNKRLYVRTNRQAELLAERGRRRKGF